MHLHLSNPKAQMYLCLLGVAAFLGLLAFFEPVASLSGSSFGVSASAGASGVDSVRLGIYVLHDFGQHMNAKDVYYVLLLFFPLLFFRTTFLFFGVLLYKQASRAIDCVIIAGVLFLALLTFSWASDSGRKEGFTDGKWVTKRGAERT